MIVRPSGRVMEVRALQSLNASSPILVRVLGKVTETRERALLKLPFITVTPSGIITLVTDIFENAFCPISRNGKPCMEAGIFTAAALPIYLVITAHLWSAVNVT
jgi:hypothetical protein